MNDWYRVIILTTGGFKGLTNVCSTISIKMIYVPSFLITVLGLNWDFDWTLVFCLVHMIFMTCWAKGFHSYVRCKHYVWPQNTRFHRSRPLLPHSHSNKQSHLGRLKRRESEIRDFNGVQPVRNTSCADMKEVLFKLISTQLGKGTCSSTAGLSRLKFLLNSWLVRCQRGFEMRSSVLAVLPTPLCQGWKPLRKLCSVEVATDKTLILFLFSGCFASLGTRAKIISFPQSLPVFCFFSNLIPSSQTEEGVWGCEFTCFNVADRQCNTYRPR